MINKIEPRYKKLVKQKSKSRNGQDLIPQVVKFNKRPSRMIIAKLRPRLNAILSISSISPSVGKIKVVKKYPGTDIIVNTANKTLIPSIDILTRGRGIEGMMETKSEIPFVIIKPRTSKPNTQSSSWYFGILIYSKMLLIL